LGRTWTSRVEWQDAPAWWTGAALSGDAYVISRRHHHPGNPTIRSRRIPAAPVSSVRVPSRSVRPTRRQTKPSLERCGPRGIGGFAVLQAAGGNGTAVHINRPLTQFGDHLWTAVVNVAVERDGPPPVSREPRRAVSAVRWARIGGQHDAKREPFPIDFGIRARRFRKCPTTTYCAAMRQRRPRCGTRRSSSAPRSNSATASVLRTAALFPDRCCRRWSLQKRTLRWTSDIVSTHSITTNQATFAALLRVIKGTFGSLPPMPSAF
jgi:hypothetical protein